MSETVERRLLELLDHPTESPYGNPIPGLDELGEDGGGEDFMADVEPLSDAAGSAEALVHVQADLRGDAEGRGADGRSAPRRRPARQDRHDRDDRRRASWSAPAVRPPSSCTRRPSTSSCAAEPGSGAAESPDIRDSPGSHPSIRCTPGDSGAQLRQPLAAPDLDLVRRQLVAAGHAAVDDHDRRARASAARLTNRRPLITVRRRPGHQQRAVVAERLDRGVAARRPARRARSPRRTRRRGLSAPPHVAGGTTKSSVSSRSTSPSGRVGAAACALEPAGVELVEPLLQCRARRRTTAGEADDVGDPAVQGDHAAAARGLVEAVDVLGDQQLGVRGAATARCPSLGSA